MTKRSKLLRYISAALKVPGVLLLSGGFNQARRGNGIGAAIWFGGALIALGFGLLISMHITAWMNDRSEDGC
ncbi:MAG: hypothetical protein DWQ34_22660 [Planctomycetota bacterium]|nr:MAG: hypothetical protein DWQ34_22660 [Planctomycetota bacterium]REK30649.1 MAG: hypothetical protein DWQ41_01485 [Planctomycetota bacterium]REK33023.1 MAG: hypothetical protein DWQ45_15585 [Planctomycetota bacterium]